VEEEIVRLRKTLTRKGLDAGAETIAAHLKIAGGDPVPAVSTIWRILARRGLVNPQPQKRPRSSWRTFCADQPNERWQADITHWRLGDDSEVEILNILDDHSRVCIASIARRITTGTQVWASFLAAFDRWGSRLRCSPTTARSPPRNSAARAGSRWKCSWGCAG
jgi:transposase InsO family protein